MANYVFMASFAGLFLGLALLIPAAAMSVFNPRRHAVRFAGMLTTATALALMGVGFLVDGAFAAHFPLGNLVFVAAAFYFAYDTVKKAVSENKNR